MNIKGCAAIVTGGASGLGAAAAARLAADGARVAILDIQAPRAELAPGSVYEPADVTDELACARALEAITAQLGPPRVLVNAAGFGAMGATATPAGPLPLADFRRLIDVNLIGTFNVARLVAARMIHNTPRGSADERGVIVHTASIAGLEGHAGMAAYSASKAGVVALTLPMALDLAPHGIRVCSIAPGLFETPLLANLPPGMHEQLVKTVPFPRRGGEPAEFAALVAAIIANPYLNGCAIRIDGGAR
ncbi:MAG: SDR family NAD(P)-dependent oxidoreductase [Gammaproteobacteria bacterium]|nr:SDR family NAD(P)-dependent oxidoreductase [Gammaproteobacteria bacterium]